MVSKQQMVVIIIIINEEYCISKYIQMNNFNVTKTANQTLCMLKNTASPLKEMFISLKKNKNKCKYSEAYN